MKQFFVFIVLLIAMSGFGIAQTTPAQQSPNAPVRKSPLAEYAGTWVGTFEGRPWIVVRLVSQGTALSGSVQRAREFQFADSGALKSVSQDQITESVDSAALQGDGLLITVKDPSTQQPTRYLMRVTGANTADLKMVAMSMPPGMPKPQLWKLTKAAAGPTAPAQQEVSGKTPR